MGSKGKWVVKTIIVAVAFSASLWGIYLFQESAKIAATAPK